MLLFPILWRVERATQVPCGVQLPEKRLLVAISIMELAQLIGDFPQDGDVVLQVKRPTGELYPEVTGPLLLLG